MKPGERSGQDRPRALILRAELECGGKRWVTHTIDVSETSLTLAADSLARGDRVRATLSFPALVAPFEVDVVVAWARGNDGHGRPAFAVCDVVSGRGAGGASLARLVEATRRAATGGRTPSTPPMGYRCLLVEDNRFIRELFAYGMDRYCASRGAFLSMESAEDAENAWVRLSRDRFDMAIIDHYLPLQSGSQLIARMRADTRLAATSVVAISVGGPEARQEAMEAGADLFLDKPVVMRELFSTLDKLTAR